MKKLTMLLCLLSSFAVADQGKGLDFFADFQTGLEQARQSHKRIVVEFFTDW